MKLHRIAINALTISKRPSGNKTYLFNLVEALSEAGENFEFFVLCNEEIINLFREHGQAKNCHFISFPLTSTRKFMRVAIEQLVLPFWLWRHRIHLLFAARNIMPLLTLCPTVVAVHSMHLNYKLNEMPWYQRLYGRTFLRATAKRAAAILAVSNYAGETYAAQYDVSNDRLFISYEGYKFPDPERMIKNLVGDEYILFVSTLFPHKNISFLLEVHALVAEKVPEIKLVIVGRDPEQHMPDYEREARGLGIRDRVDFRGAVTDDDLANLYEHARVFVFPSLIEGFGLPALEAMSHGVPVVVSNRTSLPEVVGDAGSVLDPDNPEVWADRILEILKDDSMHEALSKRGKRRAQLFTWERTAEITLDCFNTVIRLAEKS